MPYLEYGPAHRAASYSPKAGASSMLRYSSSLPRGTNRTRSPADMSDGGSRSTSNSLNGVRPISCQPPGLASGYTPVWLSAIPTEPAGMTVRGVVSLGVASLSRQPPQVREPPA